jgi:hypothetical protein
VRGVRSAAERPRRSLGEDTRRDQGRSLVDPQVALVEVVRRPARRAGAEHLALPRRLRADKHEPAAPETAPVAPTAAAAAGTDETDTEASTDGTAPGTPPGTAPAEPEPEPTQEPTPRPKREFHLPTIPGVAASVVTGVVIGLLAVLLTGLSLRLCELLKGMPSCGGPGIFLLIAILILLTYVGGWLLRAWRITDPISTSFLAVGLLAVIAMLFFIDALFSPWMLLVIPVVAAGTYALSWWVTTTFVDVEDSSDLR